MFYSGDLLSFHRSSLSNGCKLPLSDFYKQKLEESPASATVIGSDHVQLAEGLVECEVIRTKWNRDVPDGPKWHFVRTMCIDPVRHLILRDHTEAMDATSDLHSIDTTTVTSFERDPEFRPEVFEFSIPTGTMEDQGPQQGSDEPVPIDGVYPMGIRVSYPRLVSKVEPSYTEEARESRLSGLVLVSLEVGRDGKPQNMKVVRGLGHGLDEKAIESVRQWYFDPGMADGVPVAVGPLTVAVNFRLP
jgi:TonB family protein